MKRRAWSRAKGLFAPALMGSLANRALCHEFPIHAYGKASGSLMVRRIRHRPKL